MHRLRDLAKQIPIAALTLCLLQPSARATDYYVDPSGENGAYTTIQAALDAVSGQSPSNRANVFIAPGTYVEQVTVSKPNVSIIGQGPSAESVKVTFNSIPISGVTFGESFTVSSSATAFSATNLTLENSTPDQNITQALAIRSSADRAAFLNVRFLGYQDTVLVDSNSRQYFRDCFITGDTDFIFGDATAVFDNATIESTYRGYITAARTADTTPNGLVFLDCTLVKGSDRSPLDDGTTAQKNTVFLGRPWRWADAGTTPSTIFIRTKMDDHITTAGWDPWGNLGDPDPVTRYSEFGSTDLNGDPLVFPTNPFGGTTGRASWADPMTAEQADNYILANLFGTVSFWNDNPAAVPEGTGVTYLPQGDGQAWDPIAQLALLPSSLHGDFNNDGRVDAADYTVWRDGFGTAFTQADYDDWKSHFGEGGGSAALNSSSYTVPEPSTYLMIGTAALLCLAPCFRAAIADAAKPRTETAAGWSPTTQRSANSNSTSVRKSVQVLSGNSCPRVFLFGGMS
jgi:pectinesterase